MADVCLCVVFGVSVCLNSRMQCSSKDQDVQCHSCTFSTSLPPSPLSALALLRVVLLCLSKLPLTTGATHTNAATATTPAHCCWPLVLLLLRSCRVKGLQGFEYVLNTPSTDTEKMHGINSQSSLTTFYIQTACASRDAYEATSFDMCLWSGRRTVQCNTLPPSQQAVLSEALSNETYNAVSLTHRKRVRLSRCSLSDAKPATIGNHHSPQHLSPLNDIALQLEWPQHTPPQGH